MDFASTSAVSSSFAPFTVQVISLLAPSPSAAILRARSCMTACNASQNASYAGPSAVISALPAIPFARTVHISLVEVSPSTVTRLKVRFTLNNSALRIISLLTAQSVVMKHSIVPIFGWIMPEPLQIPPMWQVVPSISNSTAIVFTFVSVVMIASAATRELSYFISISPA